MFVSHVTGFSYSMIKFDNDNDKMSGCSHLTEAVKIPCLSSTHVSFVARL